MTNLPILYRNVMDGLPSDFARDVFLWAVERPGEDRMCYRAEAFAQEADRVARSFYWLLDAQAWTVSKASGRLLDEAQRADLFGFMLTRHANHRYGGNLKPAYATRGCGPRV
jgi:hypothetical protein